MNRTVIKSHIEKLYVVTIVIKHLYDRHLKEVDRKCTRLEVFYFCLFVYVWKTHDDLKRIKVLQIYDMPYQLDASIRKALF
jgi:hypothetical protein